MARNHAELIAGGLAALLEGGIEPDARLLGCCATGSFAGLALDHDALAAQRRHAALHHGFDADAFAAQCRDDRCDTVVVPGALVPQLAEAGLLAHAELKNVLAVWRAPERLMTSPAWQHPNASLTDMLIFGETALIGSRRDADGLAVPLPPARGDGAARLGQRRAGRRDRPHRSRHARAARTDGAAPSLPARRRAPGPRRTSRPTPKASSTPSIPAGSIA